MVYTVYVLRSLSSGFFYVGQTQHLDKRLVAHNVGESKWTKNKGPWVMVYSEEYESRGEAMKREKWLKSGIGRDFIRGRASSF